ncbi:hypothetical protein PENTCL1PPCAC_3867, partial [Pristionchus entomophagus]
LQMRPSSCASCASDATVAYRTPLCAVCNSTKKVGIHYGVMSCSGCKFFFRRTVHGRRKLRCCEDNDRCEITETPRKHCRSCRFQKCLTSGMNPKLVREEKAKNDNSVPQINDHQTEISEDEPIPQTSGEHNEPVIEQSNTERLSDPERAADEELSSERAELRNSVPEQIAILTIDKDTNFRCERIMTSNDLNHCAFIALHLLFEWAKEIPSYRTLPQSDQMLLLRQNSSVVSWLHFMYQSIQSNQEITGAPLGNGSYIPYKADELSTIELKYQHTYGILAKKLVEMVGIPMREMDMDHDEYCLLKAIALFKFDNELTKEGQRAVLVFRHHLNLALIKHIEKRFPTMPPDQRTMRCIQLTELLPSLMQIGHLEAGFVQQLSSPYFISMTAAAAEQSSGPSSAISHTDLPSVDAANDLCTLSLSNPPHNEMPKKHSGNSPEGFVDARAIVSYLFDDAVIVLD